MFEIVVSLLLISAAVVLVPILPELFGGNSGNYYNPQNDEIEDMDPAAEAEHKRVTLEGFGCHMYCEDR